MIDLSNYDVFVYLLLAARWTLVLSAIAFAGGGIAGSLLLMSRYAYPGWGARAVDLYTSLVQGTPLLLQLFLVFFGLPLLGIEVSPLLAAGIALTLYSSAFLAEIWRGCVDAVPKGQWEASASLGMGFLQQMSHVVLPQALRISVAPTVGFLVQLVKSTALASIVGFSELTRGGQVLANATFQPFQIFGFVALIYFAMCYPLTVGSRILERKLGASH